MSRTWYRTALRPRKQNTVIAMAENVRATSVGYATPATPACSTKMPIALPTTLITLEAADTYSVTFVSFMLRQSAAPAL